MVMIVVVVVVAAAAAAAGLIARAAHPRDCECVRRARASPFVGRQIESNRAENEAAPRRSFVCQQPLVTSATNRLSLAGGPVDSCVCVRSGQAGRRGARIARWLMARSRASKSS